MGNDIEEVKKAIEKVEQQILDVERTLLDVETGVKKPATGVDTGVYVAHLQKKEEQLRNEKEQLRKEKEQLRDKELLLLKADTSDLSGIRESLKRMEDVIGISFICVKRELMFTTSKQSSRPGNGIFKQKLISFYGVHTTDPSDPKQPWTRYIRCMVTNYLLPQVDVTAAHLIGYSKRHYAPMLLGMSDLDSPKNGLLLLKPLEDAFDDSRVCFSYDKLADSFILHILDADYLDRKLADKKGLAKHTKATLGDTTFGDLEGRVIIFPNRNRPFKRALHFHAKQAISLSKERDTLPQGFCIDSWDFDYGSAGDYKDVVDRWFTKNAEYHGSKERSKEPDFVDEGLVTSGSWSEDPSITPEAKSEIWSEEAT